MASKVMRSGNSPDLWFDGWYVFASWFVTGESRPYKRKVGNFGPVDAKSKYGAVELAARYSTIDLTNKDIKGGTQDNVSLGLNWYIGPHVRVMANYIFVWADDDADDNGKVIGGDNPQILQTRLQFQF
jgi:phosphate-selective porin OprO/OprP